MTFFKSRRIFVSLLASAFAIAGLVVGVVPVTAGMEEPPGQPPTNSPNCESTPQRDVFDGTSEDESCDTDGGNDSLFGRGGNDGLNGGAGRDEVRGGPGMDDVEGGPGNDMDSGRTGRREGVFGGSGDDNVRDNAGDADRDRVFGGDGDDMVNTADGDGNDLADGGANADLCIIDQGDNVRSCRIVQAVSPGGEQ